MLMRRCGNGTERCGTIWDGHVSTQCPRCGCPYYSDFHVPDRPQATEMTVKLNLSVDLSEAGTVAVLADVLEERRRQDAEFGGAEHNDTHTPAEWVAMTVKQLGKGVAHCGAQQASPEYRRRMVNVAALAVSAVESWDRGRK